MGAAVDLITARLAAGEDVTPDEYAAARTADEFALIAAAAQADRETERAEEERAARIEQIISDLAIAVDRASETLADASVTAIAALDAASEARRRLEEIVQQACHDLAHKCAYFTRPDQIMDDTGWRVLYVPINDVAGRETHTLAAGGEWIRWRDHHLVLRQERITEVGG